LGRDLLRLPPAAESLPTNWGPSASLAVDDDGEVVIEFDSDLCFCSGVGAAAASVAGVILDLDIIVIWLQALQRNQTPLPLISAESIQYFFPHSSQLTFMGISP
jgi:hypothetical protein